MVHKAHGGSLRWQLSWSLKKVPDIQIIRIPWGRKHVQRLRQGRVWWFKEWGSQYNQRKWIWGQGGESRAGRGHAGPSAWMQRGPGLGEGGGAEIVKGNGFLSSTNMPTTAAEPYWAVLGRKERKGTDSYHGVRARDNWGPSVLQHK